MRTIVQIPFFNEERHLPLVIHDVTTNLGAERFSWVGIIGINDGSTDRSLDVAQKAGVTDIVDLKRHCGLGVAFKEGLRRAIQLDADIIVNTDADSQYGACDIHKLVEPILDNKADMVIGDRQIAGLPDYPWYKYMAQATGNFVVSALLGGDIKDATSGFRALSRDTAKLLIDTMSNQYTYTLESICILLKRNKRIMFVPVSIHRPLRESRLITSKLYYVKNYLGTLVRYSLFRRG